MLVFVTYYMHAADLYQPHGTTQPKKKLFYPTEWTCTFGSFPLYAFSSNSFRIQFSWEGFSPKVMCYFLIGNFKIKITHREWNKHTYEYLHKQCIKLWVNLFIWKKKKNRLNCILTKTNRSMTTTIKDKHFEYKKWCFFALNDTSILCHTARVRICISVEYWSFSSCQCKSAYLEWVCGRWAQQRCWLFEFMSRVMALTIAIVEHSQYIWLILLQLEAI